MFLGRREDGSPGREISACAAAAEVDSYETYDCGYDSGDAQTGHGLLFY
jgi:hypothetical protein